MGMRKAGPPARRSASEPAAFHEIADLDQLRALSDPLRVRLIQAFCQQERTTKQVAELIGEKPTKLYHHVELLARVGLIQPTRTRQKRGTVEKYYRAVAHAFRADPRLFAGAGGEEGAAALGVVGSLVELFRAELEGLLAADANRPAGAAASSLATGILSFIEVQASERQIAQLRERLSAVLSATMKLGDDAPGKADDRRYRMLLAFYPLDGRGDAPAESAPAAAGRVPKSGRGRAPTKSQR